MAKWSSRVSATSYESIPRTVESSNIHDKLSQHSRPRSRYQLWLQSNVNVPDSASDLALEVRKAFKAIGNEHGVIDGSFGGGVLGAMRQDVLAGLSSRLFEAPIRRRMGLS